MHDFGGEQFGVFAFGFDFFENQLRLAIREADNRAFVDIRRHRERPVRIAGTCGTHDGNPVVLVEHREFERVVEKVVVVFDVQVLVVHFVSGEAAQFVKDVPFGAGDVEVAADGLPSADFAGFYIKFRTAVEHH